MTIASAKPTRIRLLPKSRNIGDEAALITNSGIGNIVQCAFGGERPGNSERHGPGDQRVSNCTTVREPRKCLNRLEVAVTLSLRYSSLLGRLCCPVESIAMPPDWPARPQSPPMAISNPVNLHELHCISTLLRMHPGGLRPPGVRIPGIPVPYRISRIYALPDRTRIQRTRSSARLWTPKWR